MAKGLGKNSPVILSLGRENYESLIDRHGQWVRWRTATKCSCIKPNTQQPDIKCKKCGGLGIIYSYQKEKLVTTTVMCRDGTGIIALDEEFRNCPLIKAYSSDGRVYRNATKSDVFVDLNETLIKGTYITCVLVEEILQDLEMAQGKATGNGYYSIDEIRFSHTSIENLWHTVPGDIVSIGKVVDAAGIEYEVKELRQNQFYIEPAKTTIIELDEEENEVENEVEIPITEPVKAYDIRYIPPFTFILLNQNLNKSDEMIMQEANGDAVLTFPYNCDVANDDVVTVLSGTITQKQALSRKKNAEYDVLPAYFVDEVTCFMGDRLYVQNVDFLLCGTNRIKWMCEDAPEEGEVYSVTYRIFPTYKVVKNIPQLRSSENQQMPKKAIVKLYDTYGEARGINKQ